MSRWFLSHKKVLGVIWPKMVLPLLIGLLAGFVVFALGDVLSSVPKGVKFALENSGSCLGVLHFDSQNLTAFDTPGTETRLEAISGRIAVALSIYKQLLKAH